MKDKDGHCFLWLTQAPGAHFSKVPKLFGCISGDIILFVSSKQRRYKTLELFSFLFPLQHMKRPASQNKRVRVLRTAFRGWKVFGTFEKRDPGSKICVLSPLITVTILSDKFCDPTECISGFVNSPFNPRWKRHYPLIFIGSIENILLLCTGVLASLYVCSLYHVAQEKGSYKLVWS